MTRQRYLRDWEQFALLDPYFAVLSEERYRAENRTQETLEQFFASGSQYGDFLISEIRRRLDPTFVPRRALDFGCGVGRLTIPLARMCEEVIAVDASQRICSETRWNCERLGLGNVRVLSLPEFLAYSYGSFHLVNSFITFQHLPVAEGERLYRRLLTAVQAGGIAALHFVYHRPGSALRTWLAHARASLPGLHGLANFLQRKALRTPYIQMNAYDLNQIFLHLQSHGFAHAYSRVTDHGGFGGVILLAQRSVDPVL
jgi:2-polyprenyl-3-methyl-5-hydroxy-6-metoxy-1,4-benzoquinol methylase